LEQSIRFFGGTTQGQVTIENGHSETWSITRDVWFDRDIDGRWLVWAGRHDSRPPGGGEDETGAILVKDPQVAAFIEMLGELIANPGKFRDEPTFGVPQSDAQPEGRV
jgi:hypothetical protein